MSKNILVDQTVEVLVHAGFIVSERCDIRPRSFDIAARKGNIMLLCKILQNIDGLTEESASEMLLLADCLGGTPLMIGEKTRDQPLEDGVIYMRYKIVALSIQTFFDYFIDDVMPLVSASPGGLYVPVDGNALKKARLESNMSLGSLAGAAGVSRRMVSKYEEEGMHASIDTVLLLEDLLKVELAKPIDILNPAVLKKNTDLQPPSEKESDAAVPIGRVKIISKETPETAAEQEMLTYVSILGYNVKETSHSPFKAISQDEKSVILTGVSKYNPTVIKRAHLMSSISDVLQTESVFLIDGTSKVKSVDSTAFIEKKELVKMSGPEDLIETIEERKVPEKK